MNDNYEIILKGEEAQGYIEILKELQGSGKEVISNYRFLQYEIYNNEGRKNEIIKLLKKEIDRNKQFKKYTYECFYKIEEFLFAKKAIQKWNLRKKDYNLSWAVLNNCQDMTKIVDNTEVMSLLKTLDNYLDDDKIRKENLELKESYDKRFKLTEEEIRLSKLECGLKINKMKKTFIRRVIRLFFKWVK